MSKITFDNYKPVKMYKFIHPTKTGGTTIKHTLKLHYSREISGGSDRNHEIYCKDHDNPIIIIRDPVDRFCSIYNYWKAGSGDETMWNIGTREGTQFATDIEDEIGVNPVEWEDDKKFKEHIAMYNWKGYLFLQEKKTVALSYIPTTSGGKWQRELEGVIPFIEGIKNNSKGLYMSHHFGEGHIRQQTKWLDTDSWGKTIVIKYTNNLDKSFKNLLKYIGCPIRHKKLFKTNTTAQNEDSIYPNMLTNEEINAIRNYYAEDVHLWNIINQQPEMFKKVI